MGTLSFTTYYDRVLGGWFGKCLGGAAGAPVEGVKNNTGISSFREIIDTTLPNDDLDIQLLWLELLKERGIWFTTADMADKWDKQCWYPFSEYGYFLKNYERGILPPDSGSFNNPFFKEGMGSPIRSEIWGMVFPGDPAMAAQYAEMDSQLDHADNSLWAEQFFAVMESMAFFVSDIQKLLDIGLSYIPSDCRLARCIALIREDHANGLPWKKVRQRVLARFSHPDFTNSIQNVGFAIIGLLYGEGDMEKTLDIVLQCGYDTDCSCATVCAILGLIHGYEAMDSSLKELVKNQFVIGIDVKCRDNTLTTLARDTCAVGVTIADMTENPVAFTELPEDLDRYHWEKPLPKMDIRVEYTTLPAIGIQDEAAVEVVLENEMDEPMNGLLLLEQENSAIVWEWTEIAITLAPHETVRIPNIARTGDVDMIPQTNLHTLIFRDNNGEQARRVFGLAGAWVFKVYGPYFDPMRSVEDPRYPPCHGEGCLLPTLEAMVNNEVFLHKAYLNEQNLVQGEPFPDEEPLGYLNAYEDLIPLDDMMGMSGQVCCYLETDVYFEKETEAWMVIGHSDAYQLFLNGRELIARDEIRLWTPYNSTVRTSFKAGRNHLVIKVLRRTDAFRFSIGIRRNREGRYYHASRWHTDLIYGVVK